VCAHDGPAWRMELAPCNWEYHPWRATPMHHPTPWRATPPRVCPPGVPLLGRLCLLLCCCRAASGKRSAPAGAPLLACSCWCTTAGVGGKYCCAQEVEALCAS